MLYGPTLHVQIGFDPDFQPGSRSRPNLPTNLLPALVDTGAGESCIDSTLARELGLPIFETQNIAGALGVGVVNYHLAQIFVPELNITTFGGFAGVHLTASGMRYFALIGRTFLRHFTTTYEGRTGAVTISND